MLEIKTWGGGPDLNLLRGKKLTKERSSNTQKRERLGGDNRLGTTNLREGFTQTILSIFLFEKDEKEEESQASLEGRGRRRDGTRPKRAKGRKKRRESRQKLPLREYQGVTHYLRLGKGVEKGERKRSVRKEREKKRKK